MTMLRVYQPAYACAPRVNRDMWSNLMESFFESDSRLGDVSTYFPKANTSANEKEYIVELLVPGKSKEDIKIELNGEVLTISSEGKKENDEGNRSVEFSAGSFKRMFSLPDDVQVDSISATCQNGVLRVILPKAEKAPEISKQIEIQ